MKICRKKVLMLMARRQWSQASLACASNVSRQSISMIMHGKDCLPETAGKISAALGVDPEEIVETE